MIEQDEGPVLEHVRFQSLPQLRNCEVTVRIQLLEDPLPGHEPRLQIEKLEWGLGDPLSIATSIMLWNRISGVCLLVHVASIQNALRVFGCIACTVSYISFVAFGSRMKWFALLSPSSSMRCLCSSPTWVRMTRSFHRAQMN